MESKDIDSCLNILLFYRIKDKNLPNICCIRTTTIEKKKKGIRIQKEDFIISIPKNKIKYSQMKLRMLGIDRIVWLDT